MTISEADQQGLETRSEAVYADGVSDDGRRGFIVRLCRYPEAGFAWVWCHLFLDEAIYAFTDHTLPCDSAETDLDSALTTYGLAWPTGGIRFERQGEQSAPGRCTLTATFSAHGVAHPPHGAGPVGCRIEASFRPSARAVSNLAGRSEVLGTVEASLSVNEVAHGLRCRGQFHEQVQTAPRFTTPFSYLTLRGPDLGVISIRLARGARGYLLRRDSMTRIERVGLSPPGSRRRIFLADGSGNVAEGTLLTTHDYTIPVFDGFRPGTLVAGTLDGRPVSGCLNDYLADGLGFERMTADGLAR